MALARITNDRDILTLIRMAAESLEVPCTRPHISPELSRVWDMWEAVVQSTIRGWARKHVRPDPDKWATRVIVEGDAPLNVYLTVNRHGAGIWDGRWDKFFIGNETYLDALPQAPHALPRKPMGRSTRHSVHGCRLRLRENPRV